MLAFVLAYVAGINAAALAVFAADKRNARARKRRFRERHLLALAALGGSPGAIAAQRLLRHKTKKEPFRTWLGLIVFVQLVAVCGWLAYRLM